MLRLPQFFFCTVLALQGSLEDSCQSALNPLLHETYNIRSRLDGIEAGQKVLDLDLKKGLWGVHKKLDSCMIQEQNDYGAILAGIENHLKALNTAVNAKDKLQCQNTMKETIASLQTQIKTREDLINAQQKQINAGFKNRDDQIADLKNLINSIETTKLNQSNELSKCRSKLDEMEPFRVSCSSSPPGWTVIQRRIDGSENFDRNWADYKKGFGNVKGEFFIGLEKLHQLTEARPHELYIKLGKVNGSTSYAHYDGFSIGSEDELYELKSLGKYSGEAGDSLFRNKNKKFTTFDRDSDEYNDGNCAEDENGGWWYGGCGFSFLSGKYYKDGQITNENRMNGIYWGSWQNNYWTISLTYVEMMIRPKSS
ncbi:fibrinogen-like protein 1 [Drosophila gunungcola]|uniref:Fibrinogen C-terminal domain-containing protein n=1 Tax=Drosophila gunungcola TaxID=103775 RepID=A0A9Q0BIQ3_9MUSC|nr:fibrinogen-like protein 1 [Drosophila gunungcola]KAI8033366.1 hypothetical protein M5D96_013892 [Drosophila gunungcola]